MMENVDTDTREGKQKILKRLGALSPEQITSIEWRQFTAEIESNSDRHRSFIATGKYEIRITVQEFRRIFSDEGRTEHIKTEAAEDGGAQ